MNKYALLLVFQVLSLFVLSQDDKTVTLVVSGQGVTQEEARQKALRVAIEQAFGAFISSKTEILNDKLFNDEIVSVSNGNIQNFEVVSDVQLPNGFHAVILKATVSVTRLTSFCESRGLVTEFKGSLFALNIQNQELSEKNEIICLNNLKNTLSYLSSLSFDYEIEVSDPVLSKTSNTLYNVPIKVKCKANKNLENWIFLFRKTIIELAMSEGEVMNYMKLNKPTFGFLIPDFKIEIDNDDNMKISSKSLYFRSKESLKILNDIFAHILFGIQNFEVNNNIEKYSLLKFKTRERKWYTSNEDSEIQQREKNYIMSEFNYISLGRSGPNVFDGCYPCLYEKDLFYLIYRGYANRDVSMKNEISFYEIFKLIGKVVAIYEFNDVLDLDSLKKISKYEVKAKSL